MHMEQVYIDMNNVRQKHILGMIWLSTEYFYDMGIWIFPDIGAGILPTNSEFMRYSRTWELSVFPHTCFVICEFTHPMVWELYGFLLHKKYFRAHNFGIFVFSPYSFRTTGIHSFHVLEIAWISISREIFKKPLTFQCFCFAIFFSIDWEFTFSILEKINPIVSHSKEKILGKHKFVRLCKCPST